VIDFGLVKMFTDEPSAEDVTASHTMIGTPAYMSPENVLGKPVDGRSDLYALGILLFEMLTGDRPFHGETQLEVATSRLHGPAPALGSEHPPALARLVADLLEREPDARTASAEQLVRQLGAWRTSGFTPTTLLDADHTIAPIRGPAALRPSPAPAPAPSLSAVKTAKPRGSLSPYLPAAVLVAALLVALVGVRLGTTPAETLETLEAPTIAVPTPSRESEALRADASDPRSAASSAEPGTPSMTPAEGSASEGSGANDEPPSEAEEAPSVPDQDDPEEPASRAERSDPSDRRTTSRTGTLEVNASPYAAVFVDGEQVDEETPSELSLPAGEYEVSTRYYDSLLSETVRVRAGETVAITHRHD
jgi:serine/threonine protein kinase